MIVYVTKQTYKAIIAILEANKKYLLFVCLFTSASQ